MWHTKCTKIYINRIIQLSSYNNAPSHSYKSERVIVQRNNEKEWMTDLCLSLCLWWSSGTHLLPCFLRLHFPCSASFCSSSPSVVAAILSTCSLSCSSLQTKQNNKWFPLLFSPMKYSTSSNRWIDQPRPNSVEWKPFSYLSDLINNHLPEH